MMTVLDKLMPFWSNHLRPVESHQRHRGRSSKMINPFLPTLSCLLILLCSVTHGLYDSANNGVDSHSQSSNERIFSLAGDGDGLVWEYILKTYSSSGNVLNSGDVVRMVQSMQKCDRGKGASEHDDDLIAELDRRKDDPSYNSTQVSNCNKIMDSITLKSKDAYYNESSFARISKRLLYYIDNPNCCLAKYEMMGSDEESNDKENAQMSIQDRALSKKEKPTSGEVWGYGFLCVTIISLSSLVGVSLMPFMAKEFYKHLLTVMIGLAVGSLTGSAIFHLIPQALKLEEHDPDRDYLHISMVVAGGIWMFFMVERILKFIMDYKDRKNKSWKREKMSSVLSNTPESSTIAVTENGSLMKGPYGGDSNGEQRNSLIFSTTTRDTDVIYECQEQAIKASFGHQEKPRLSNGHGHHDNHRVTFEQGKDSVIATVAWMIIFGDGLHNFIDGLSIGAAFNESIWTGVSISLAVLCEELPHELGDFAVLLNAGMSMKQAVLYNFLSACTCYVGMAAGILLGEVEASVYIFALAGGMFLYISLVDMVPEMNEIAQETGKISVKRGMITLLLQNLGLVTGVVALYMLAMYQDHFQF